MKRLKNIAQKGEKTYSGSYEYLKSGETYGEEFFETYIHSNSHLFFADILCPIPSGETFKTEIDAKFNQHFQPLSIKIVKKLDNQKVTESFIYHPSKIKLNIAFKKTLKNKFIQMFSLFNHNLIFQLLQFLQAFYLLNLKKKILKKMIHLN